MKSLVQYLLVLSLFGTIACSSNVPTLIPRQDANEAVDLQTNVVTGVEATDVFSTPASDGHKAFIDAINKAQTNIRMWMFNFTDDEVATALVSAKARGIQTQVILNKGMFPDTSASGTVVTNSAGTNVISKLENAGIQVFKSSDGFSITHAKTLMVDDKFVLITTINLTMNFAVQRDAGVRVEDKTVIHDLNALFEADILNSKDQGTRTPAFESSSLVVSPVNSVDRLTQLIDMAKKDISLTVENLSKGPISAHLQQASQRGVNVRVITPLCDLNTNQYFNIPALQQISQSGANTRVMPAPASVTNPYMHQKMMVIDQSYAYVGSENFTDNSLNRAREIGVIINSKEALTALQSSFDQDWNVSVSVPTDANLPRCKEF